MKTQVVAAFAAIYLIWGSTFLAIRFVVEAIPPFFMAGARFLIAGLILYAWVRLRGSSPVSLSNWGGAFAVGGLMLLGDHGAVVWAEQWVPSGLAALLIATVPLWMAFLSWLFGGGRLGGKVVGGLVLGFAGVALLVGPWEILGEARVDLVSAAVLVFGASLWAAGSLYSRSGRLPASPLLATAMEMIAGGLLLLLASLVSDEWMRIRLDQFPVRPMVAWLYLVVFGSLVGFTSYIWLLKMVQPSRVSTYAYVNPVVAMLLGWALASEELSARSILAGIIILVSVIVITTFQMRGKLSSKGEAESSSGSEGQ